MFPKPREYRPQRKPLAVDVRKPVRHKQHHRRLVAIENGPVGKGRQNRVLVCRQRGDHVRDRKGCRSGDLGHGETFEQGRERGTLLGQVGPFQRREDHVGRVRQTDALQKGTNAGVVAGKAARRLGEARGVGWRAWHTGGEPRRDAAHALSPIRRQAFQQAAGHRRRDRHREPQAGRPARPPART